VDCATYEASRYMVSRHASCSQTPSIYVVLLE